MTRFPTLVILLLTLASVPATRAQIPYDLSRCEPARIRRTVERLNEPVMFPRNFKDADRVTVYEYLSEWFDLTIVIDAKGLSKAGETPFEDQKVTFGAADVSSAHDAIRQTLAGTDGVYVIVDENWIEIMPMATFARKLPLISPIR